MGLAEDLPRDARDAWRCKEGGGGQEGRVRLWARAGRGGGPGEGGPGGVRALGPRGESHSAAHLGFRVSKPSLGPNPKPSLGLNPL
jgi:hypothetical protein